MNNSDAIIRELVYENAQLRARLANTVEAYEEEIEILEQELDKLMGEFYKSHQALWDGFTSAVVVALKEQNE